MANEINTKTKSSETLRCCCNKKVFIVIYPFPSVLYFPLPIWFIPDQECIKYDQIAALNKNAFDFITFSLYSLYVYNFYFIHVKTNSH